MLKPATTVTGTSSHSRRNPDLPRTESNGVYTAEPLSKDFLQIPAHRTAADVILNWGIFVSAPNSIGCFPVTTA